MFEEADRLVSGLAVSRDGGHASVLVTRDGGGDGEVVVFATDSVGGGPVLRVAVEEERFGRVGESAGGLWADVEGRWSEEQGEAKRSAYEIFEARRWNDIDSSFSSLGMR